MDRDLLIKKYENPILEFAKESFELDPGDLSKFDAYEGCANLVYRCMRKDVPVILRVSYRPDRTYHQLLGEIDFIQFLAKNHARVSTPICSNKGNFVEEINVGEQPFYLVCFSKGVGVRVPDNNYHYRDDAPIEEYYRNWGQTLGLFHSLSKKYVSKSSDFVRPDWFDLHAQELEMNSEDFAKLPLVSKNIKNLLVEINSLPKTPESYGLIHGDFNDGNFTVNYSNGEMTVFDFDDCCYFWYAYELASAWEGGIGRVMFRDVDERKNFMDEYMNHVLAGYSMHNVLPDEWINRIPLFIKLIQVQEFLYFAQYLHSEDQEIQGHLQYLIACIEHDLPYMGFFDSIFDPKNPFRLSLS